MNRKFWMSAILSGTLLLVAGTVRAQETTAATGVGAVGGNAVFMLQQGEVPPIGPAEAGAFGVMTEGVELLGFAGPHGGKAVTGSPFSATAVSETTQTLADGNHITRKTQSNLYRDSQGRFRKEVSLSAIGPLAARGQPHSFIVIQDPVTGTNFVLEQDEKIARKLPERLPIGPEVVKERVEYRVQTTVQPDAVKKESLGTQTISGVNAEGTRVTRTIPAGEIGNELPITIVSEQWYSNDLKMLVMSKRSDPRFGETTYTLENIQRVEPDASLFAVPQDYSIEEGGPHMKRFHVEVPPPPSN